MNQNNPISDIPDSATGNLSDNTPPASQRFFSPRTATAVIVANMIGTGVFTSLGFQLNDINSGFALLLLWVIGGLTAFCGALCYAELGAQLPRSGGEYNFLSEAIHPSLGFVSGWISATIGFAAPTALVAITFGRYVHVVFEQIPATLAAIALIVTLAFLHASSRSRSGQTQLIFTALKIIAILGACGLALALTPQTSSMTFAIEANTQSLLLSTPYAVALIYVSYAYSGWNAATYFSSELARPQRDLPRILAIGTISVTLLYVLINFVFLRLAPADVIRGKLEIVHVVANYAFGPQVAAFSSLLLAMLLISSASAMLLAAPRVLQVIGQDFPFFAVLARSREDGVPHVAIYTQAAIALVLIVTSTFEAILVFSGYTLALNTLVTVLALFVLRWRRPGQVRPFSAWGYPVTPLIFLTLTFWVIWHITANRPTEAMYSGLIIFAGFAVYFLMRRFTPPPP